MLHGEAGIAPEGPVGKLAELAYQRLGEMSDVQEARGLGNVLANLAELTQLGQRRRWRFFRPVALVGAVAALVLVAVGLGSSWRGRPLTYTMSDGEIQAGGYFRIAAHAHPALQFSDGTKLALTAGARGRVAHVGASGARVMLDDGEAHVEVVPRAGSQWLFDAGPFSIHVQGTAFDLAWKGDEGRLDVRLHRGAVSVTGPVSDQAISMHAGQWLTVRLATHEVFVRNLEPGVPWSGGATSPAPDPGLAPAAPAREPASPLPSKPPRARLPSHPGAAPSDDFDWASARAGGHWNRILDFASKRGVDRVLAERSSEELALLADAAHYLHHDDLAEKSLLAQRRRFPGSTRAKDAAFLLGRIVEARAGGAGESLTWYDRHLDEAPDGVYASEALGRKMIVLGRLRGEQAARPVADEYLRRYPAGTYARAARAYARKP